MKKILGIIGSPRKTGNCEIMVKEISNNISEPHELQLLRLSDFNILPCIGCYTCLFKKGVCIQNDDLTKVLNPMIEADALIVAVPAYFLGANACLKRFLDRGLSFYTHIEKLWGTPAVGVGIAGIKGKEGYTLLNIESFLNLTFSQNKQSTIIYGALPGEIFLNKNNKNVAAQLAASLFGPKHETKTPSCSVCGGSTFRFMGNNEVRCMLCSNDGIFSVQGTQPVFEINRSEHELFLSKKEALLHKAWLVGMKNRFLEEKDKLKKISVAYKDGGTWIKP